MSSEQNVTFDENDASLTDYPPVNNINITPRFTVIESFERPTMAHLNNRMLTVSNKFKDQVFLTIKPLFKI